MNNTTEKGSAKKTYYERNKERIIKQYDQNRHHQETAKNKPKDYYEK